MCRRCADASLAESCIIHQAVCAMLYLQAAVSALEFALEATSASEETKFAFLYDRHGFSLLQNLDKDYLIKVTKSSKDTGACPWRVI